MVSSYGILTNQPLLFHATSDLHQIRLDMNKGFDIYTLEFDVYTDNLRDSDYSFTVNVDTPQVQNYDFHGANVIEVFNTTIRVLLLMWESDRSQTKLCTTFA